MITSNLRHLRLFLAVVDLRTLTAAADACGVTQPAATHALHRLETLSGGALISRTVNGVFLTDRGQVLAGRIRRAFDLLDPALSDIAPQLPRRVTLPQLQAIIATAEAENFTLAARQMQLSQPTVHRAVATLEREIGRPLFDRTGFGLVPTRACRSLVRAARLMVAELLQAATDLAELDGDEGGLIVIGALPLSRTALLPGALARFRKVRRNTRVAIYDGLYDELLSSLRSGRIDMLLGALRDPPPIDDIEQEFLFEDRLAIVSRPGHPLAHRRSLSASELVRFGWVVPRAGTPVHKQFSSMFIEAGLPQPQSLIESGSVLMMRELLGQSELLGCIPAAQAHAELQRGLLKRLDVAFHPPGRQIGITLRSGWKPTVGQRLMLDAIRQTAEERRSMEAGDGG
ncbi:LysR family transcriptional regulator [Ruegeria marina]|uniref:DNA-binding transcriptional regulator, LysR family n=1 Tax=Ruegeria marina TaxID=639004 RepID=A0A1G7BKS4_9RHOB|nr:LysR family transcriptional regulator [Ruegeria marina]SDE27543.1 DNA-binding transcriptional regulator, LysR family [Ruegeria marina]